MRRRKHKRIPQTVVLVTSDAPAAELKQMKISPWLLRLAVGALCIVIGLVVGYFVYEDRIWDAAIAANQDKAVQIEELQEQNKALQAQMVANAAEYERKIDSLEDEIQLLSNSLNTTIKSEEVLSQQLEKQMTPTEFPLSGSASMEETTENDHVLCVFTAPVGTNVVATASGTVEAINDDVDYGHNIWINHGNGYVTIYRNKGDVQVKLGDSVVQGTTVFSIANDNAMLGYQIMLNGEYIDPMDILAING